MKILLLRSYFHPENVASSSLGDNLRQAFANEDFDMELHTPTPTRGISHEIREKYKKIKYEEQLNGKLRIYRFYMFAESKNPVLRALRYFLCNVVHFYKGLKAKNINILLIASTPPTNGAMGALLKKAIKVPFVYWLQDIFPDSLVGTGLTRKYSPFWKIGRIVEDFTYRNADKIIVISEDFKKNLLEKGVPESKIEVIYNWVDENLILPVLRENNNLFDEFGLNRKDFYVVYAGNLGHAQNIDVIIESAAKLQNHENIKFVIFGSGGLEARLKNMINDLKLENIYFFPRQPINKISEVYSLGNVAIVSCKPGLGMSAMPSKTWSIMSSGTALIASFDEGTELQRIVEDNKVGLFSDAGDVDKLTAAILKMCQNPGLCEEFGRNGRDFVLKNLTRDIGTSKYVELIKSLVNKQNFSQS